MARFAFVLKQFRLEDEGLKPKSGQSNFKLAPTSPPCHCHAPVQSPIIHLLVFPAVYDKSPPKPLG
jgi:hypothetical protein